MTLRPESRMLEVRLMLKNIYYKKKAELEKTAYDYKADPHERALASERLMTLNFQAQQEGIVSLEDLKARRVELDRQIKEAEAA